MLVYNVIVVFIILFEYFVTPIRCIDLCEDVCNGKPDHILCKYPKEGAGPQCEYYKSLSLTKREKISLLDRLNERRNRVAAGVVSYMPSASNMMRLVWNEDLSAMAQRWADQCVNHQNPDKSDTCRDLETMKVGQNIATVLGDTPGLTNTALVEMWYMESFNYNRTFLGKYQPSRDVGRRHFDYFTQLIWAKSFMVGCGGATFSENYKDKRKKQTVHRLVCNFAPAGNIVGSQVYSVGDSCSDCPNGTECDTVYKGLCKTSAFHESDSNSIKINNINKYTSIFEEDSSFLSFSTSNNVKKENDYEKHTTNSISNHSISTIDVDAEESPYELIDLIYSRKPLLEDPKRTQNPNPLKNNINVDELVEIVKERLKNDLSFLQSLAINRYYTNTTSILSSLGESLDRLLQRSSNDSQVNDILNLVYTAYPTTSVTYKTPDYEDTNSTILNELAELLGVSEENTTQEVVDYETAESDVSTEEKLSFEENVAQIIGGDSAEYNESVPLGAAESDTETIFDNSTSFTTTKSFLDAILDEEDVSSTTAVFIFSPEVGFEPRGQTNLKKWLDTINNNNNNQTKNVPFDVFFKIQIPT